MVKWNKNKLMDRARKELRNGEKAVREQLQDVVLEKAARELARHTKDKPQIEDPPATAVPSGQSTGVSYGSSSRTTTERRAPVSPEEALNDANGDQTSFVTESSSAPLLGDISLPDPSPSPQSSIAETVSHIRPEDVGGDVASQSPIADSGPLPTRELLPAIVESSHTTTVEITNVSTEGTYRPRSSGFPRLAPHQHAEPLQTNSARSISNPADSDSDSHERRPSSSIKVTGYRILNTVVIITFGVWKGVASFRGEAIMSNTLDILLGVVLTIGLFWLGCYEAVQPPRMIWLFHRDYAVLLHRPPTWHARPSPLTVSASQPYVSSGVDAYGMTARSHSSHDPDGRSDYLVQFSLRLMPTLSQSNARSSTLPNY
ncbi:hypothetical protein BDY19DRAFT_960865 [Irpex rosettiformis]|uniref:Uncharacterized protein n=1 Tax=Irpex rosettiformis TaxID=378272 RepID=A0ACB8TWA0_9APHY|nr:hypothetical protein BDY19DRAFT_960865 [Irpex rosettiformis]